MINESNPGNAFNSPFNSDPIFNERKAETSIVPPQNNFRGANKSIGARDVGDFENSVNKDALTARLNPVSRLKKIKENSLNKKKADDATTSVEKKALFSWANSKAVERKKIIEHLLADKEVELAMGLKGMHREGKIKVAQGMVGGIRGYEQKDKMVKLGEAIKWNKRKELEDLLPGKVVSRLQESRYKKAVLDNITRMTKHKF